MAHIQDRGKDVERRWQARYQAPDGGERSKTFRRKVDAQRWLDEATADIVTGRYVDPKAGKVTFGRFAERWLAAQTFDPSTCEAVTSRLNVHILPTFRKVELRAIRRSMVQAWLRGRQQELAPRQGETFGLAVDAVDFLRHTVHIRQQVKLVAGKRILAPPKGGKIREVPLPEWVAVALAEHLRRRPPIEVTVPWRDVAGEPRTSPLIFATRESGPVNRNYFNPLIWKPALEAVGIAPTRDHGMHALRHHYASVLLDGGISIRALAEYLGHSDGCGIDCVQSKVGICVRQFEYALPVRGGQLDRLEVAGRDEGQEAVLVRGPAAVEQQP